jgi:hypothetical protein
MASQQELVATKQEPGHDSVVTELPDGKAVCASHKLESCGKCSMGFEDINHHHHNQIAEVKHGHWEAKQKNFPNLVDGGVDPQT